MILFPMSDKLLMGKVARGLWACLTRAVHNCEAGAPAGCRRSALLGFRARHGMSGLTAMSFGNSIVAQTCCPGGPSDNSPTFQRWVRARLGFSPEGTAERTSEFNRPFGTNPPSALFPTFKRWAILIMSLRDEAPVNFRKAMGPHTLILFSLAVGSGLFCWPTRASGEAEAEGVTNAVRAPKLSPDYARITIPPNIAPLNFKAWAECDFNGKGVSMEIAGFTAQGMSEVTMRAAALRTAADQLGF